MADEDLNQARLALNSFMSQMNQWESRFYRDKREAVEAGRDSGPIDDAARARLTEILASHAYSEPKNEGRLIDLGCTDPPSYDPASDVEESAVVEKGTVVFVMQQKVGMQNTYRFTLKRQGDSWKINKKELLNFQDKWQRSVL